MPGRPCRFRIRLPARPGIGVTPGDRPWPGAGEHSAAGLPGNLAAEITARGHTEPGDLCPDDRMARPPVTTPGSADERIVLETGTA